MKIRKIVNLILVSVLVFSSFSFINFSEEKINAVEINSPVINAENEEEVTLSTDETEHASTIKEQKESEIPEEIEHPAVIKEEENSESIDPITHEEQDSDVVFSDLELEEESKLTNGMIAEVTTFDELRLAVANPEVSEVEVMNNLTRSGTETATAVGSLNRDLIINGNGHSIMFGADNGSLNLSALAEGESATLRVVNTAINKAGEAAIFNASETGLGWTLELEDITEISENTSGLALIPEGKVIFTGGISRFINTSVTNIFVEAKDIEVKGSSEVMINRGNAFVFHSDARVENPSLTLAESSVLDITTASGTSIPINFQGTSAKIDVRGESSLSIQTQGTMDIATNTTNNTVAMTGTNPYLSVTEKSTFNISTTNEKRGIALTGTSATINFENSKIVQSSERGAAIYVENDNSKIESNNATLDIETTTGSGINMNGHDNTILLENSSEVSINSASGNNILMVGNNANLTIEEASTLTTDTGEICSIRIVGDAPKLKIVGEGTKVEATSRYITSRNATGTIYIGSGADSVSIENFLVEVGNQAKLTINANISSGLAMQGNNGRFEVYNKADIQIESGDYDFTSNVANASLRFLQSGEITGGNKINLNNAKLEVNKRGGNAPAVRMFGSYNQINVLNGGDLYVQNPGNGTALDGGSHGRNQAIHYATGTNNEFNVQDPGSEVVVEALSGAAIDMQSGAGSITVRNGGHFEATGKTSTVGAGIFNAGQLNIYFDKPLFMDYQNKRFGGGNIFNVSASSVLEAQNSNLTLWKRGAYLDGDPSLNFLNLDFVFEGTNFNTLGVTNNPDIFNTETIGEVGLTGYSRLSSNNSTAVIADELRVPTNADKKVYGHISIPIGLNGRYRSAWEDEVTVTIEIEGLDGIKKEYTTQTRGDSYEKPGISIYGEEPRGGLFEVELEEFLKQGDKVRIKKAELSSNEVSSEFTNNLQIDTVEVFPIVPPNPAQFSGETIPNNVDTIVGKSINKEVDVTATLNGTEIDTNDVTISENGEFELSLRGLNLKEEDTIQVFLRDRNGSASESGVINPPETNNASGNINPVSPLYFHDTTFEPATTLTVKDAGPVIPVDPLNPDVEVDPENKPELPEYQGLISIDFVSQFNFGTKGISVQAQTYYANPQRLLNEDGTVNETEERPNYVQVSDRRSTDTRGGWELALRQEEQFQTEDGKELIGAQLQLANAELVSPQLTTQPNFAQATQIVVPGTRHSLIEANGDEGQGTWVYRFGDGATGGQSVILDVPKGSNPDAASYSTILNWELSAVPGN